MRTSKERLCIFHDKNESKNRDEFQRALQQKLRNQDYDFRGYSFFGKSSFHGYTFLKDADFKEAHFEGDADFEEARFSGKTTFRGATFSGRALFLGAKFSKEGKAEFRNTQFLGNALFSGAEFSGDTLFWQTQFSADAVFWHTKFSGQTLFLDAAFAGERRADFRDAKFSEKVDFSGADFSGDALFWQAKFSGEVTFHGARFSEEGKADFQEAKFSKNALFQCTKFSGDALFGGATFSGVPNFESSRFCGEVNFGTIDVGTLHLAESNIDTVDLTNAKWSRDFKNVYEKGAKDVEGFRKAEEIYRKVKISYHRTGDYNLGAMFYYREMECRRKQVRFRNITIISKAFKSLGYDFIRLYCGYGEKPLRVIGFSLAAIIVCAVLFMKSGIYDEQGLRLIQYDVSQTMFEILQDFWTCFYYSVITFTTVGYGDISPATGLARTIAMAEGFFGAFSIALFVLTFGRRMMR